MASTVSQPTTASTEAGAEGPSLVARLEKHRKPLSYVVGGVAVVAVGLWLFSETGKRKEAAAADALDAARSNVESGNLPAASTEFQRVIQAFRGTDAAFQAEIGLNSVRLASGQAQLAVDELRKFATSNPPAFYASAAWYMMGAALENLNKFDEAASAYQKAGDIAEEPYRRVEGYLGASRAFHLAGKDKEAVDVLRNVVGKFPKETAGVAEAEVRLAELTKGAM